MAVDRIGNHLKQTKNGTVFTGRYNNLNELMGEVGSEGHRGQALQLAILSGSCPVRALGGRAPIADSAAVPALPVTP